MKKIEGIRFKPGGKVYDFDCGAFVLKQGDSVIVETEQGLGFGTVAFPPLSEMVILQIQRPTLAKYSRLNEQVQLALVEPPADWQEQELFE